MFISWLYEKKSYFYLGRFGVNFSFNMCSHAMYSQNQKNYQGCKSRKHSTSYPTRLHYFHLTCGEKDIATQHISTFIPFQKSIFKLRESKAKTLC